MNTNRESTCFCTGAQRPPHRRSRLAGPIQQRNLVLGELFKLVVSVAVDPRISDIEDNELVPLSMLVHS